MGDAQHLLRSREQVVGTASVELRMAESHQPSAQQAERDLWVSLWVRELTQEEKIIAGVEHCLPVLRLLPLVHYSRHGRYEGCWLDGIACASASDLGSYAFEPCVIWATGHVCASTSLVHPPTIKAILASELEAQLVKWAAQVHVRVAQLLIDGDVCDHAHSEGPVVVKDQVDVWTITVVHDRAKLRIQR